MKHATSKSDLGNFLAVQWLGLWASTARVPGSIPGWGTKIPASRTAKNKWNEMKKIGDLCPLLYHKHKNQLKMD